jgi:short-subunit dehydrogenase
MKQTRSDPNQACIKRVALVTGASSGIGQAIAAEMNRKGFRVYAAARSLPDNLCAELRTIRLNVNDPAAVDLAVAQIIATEGRLDCLVQSAGFGLAGAIEDTLIEEARAQLETNYFGAVNLLPPVLKQMRRQNNGLIVQIGSVAGALPIPFQAHYSASKAALAALTLALAEEVRPYHIRCMLVQPGDTRTGFTSARIMAKAALQCDYSERCKRSIDRMAADEMNGISSEKAARLVVRRMLRRRPPLVMSIGLFYKAAVIASRLLPVCLMRRLIGLIYAG